MNDADLHEMFASAVTSPAADRIDLDAVLRGGRRRHRTRVAATAGAVTGVLVVAGALVLGVLPGINEYHVQPAYQTGSPSVDPNGPVHVTTADQLLGTWVVQESARGSGAATSSGAATRERLPETVTFSRVDGRSVWEATGPCAPLHGEYSVARSGDISVVLATPSAPAACPVPRSTIPILDLAWATLQAGAGGARDPLTLGDDRDTLTLHAATGTAIAVLGRAGLQETPQVLAVACSPTGITVSSDVAAAQPSGVVLRVSSTLPSGAYLTYDPAPGGGFSSFGTGGGDRLPADPATWTLSAPPGPLTLGCTVDGDVVPRGEVTVTVVDPGGYWQPTSLDDLGCAPRGISDWAGGLGGTGATREEAVAGVVRAFGALLGTAPVVKAAHMGYVEARDQYWIASKNGAAYVTIRTWPTAQGFSAYPDLSC